MDEKRVVELMHLLQCSREEALQVIEDDKRIDRGEKLFELDAEAEKNAKKARTMPRQPTVYTFTPRERKADNDKRYLINEIFKLLELQGVQVSVTNQERELTFNYNNRKYKIVLSCPRS